MPPALPQTLLKPRKRRLVRREDPVHISIKNYLEWSLPGDWLVHHSRNGGMSKGENGRAKGLGTKKGFPDLLILGNQDVGTLTTNVIATGWLIEVKAEDGSLDSDQRKMHKRLRALGWKVGVARSIEDARSLVIEWGLPSIDHQVVQKREKPPQAAT